VIVPEPGRDELGSFAPGRGVVCKGVVDVIGRDVTGKDTIGIDVSGVVEESDVV